MKLFEFNKHYSELMFELKDYRWIEDPRVIERERALKTWIEMLPLANHERSLTMLIDGLQKLNHYSIGRQVRLILLIHYCHTFDTFLPDSNPQQPYASDRKVLLFKKFLSEIILAYQLVINDCNAHKDYQRMRIAGQGIGQYYYHLMSLCFEYYYAFPHHTWSDYRKVFYWLIDNDIANDAVQNQYKVLHLLVLADPYRMPVGHFVLLKKYLLTHIEESYLIEDEDRNQDSQCMVIEKSSAYGRLSIYLEALHNDPKQFQLLEISELITSIQAAKLRLNLGEPVYDFGNLSLSSSERILQNWLLSLAFDNEKRKNYRVHKQYSVQACCGLSASYFYLNNEQVFMAKNEPKQVIELGNVPIGYTGKNRFHQFTLKIIDEDHHGFGFEVIGKTAAEIVVGQILAFERDNLWLLAFIRWRCNQSKVLRGGAQFLPVPMKAVRFSVCPSMKNLEPGLLKISDNGIYLLSTAKSCVTGKPVAINNGRQSTYRVKQLLLDSELFECFELTV